MKMYEGNLLEQETDERLDKYNRISDKKIIFVVTELIKKFDYKTAKIKELLDPEQIGITDRFFGGNAYKAATLKDSPYVIITNKFFETIALHVPLGNLPLFTVNELLKMAEWKNIKVDKTIKKEELINLLTNS